MRASRQNSDGGRCSAELRARRPAEYPNCEASPSLELIAAEVRRKYGPVYADRWLSAQKEAVTRENARKTQQESVLEHESHTAATELLGPHRKALGVAYPLLHFLARWSFENATEGDPAPHLMTTYWTLEEAVGKSERQLRRHLVEDVWRWSEAVRHFIDVRPNYGERLDGKDELGRDKYAPSITSMVIRFFPRGRQSSEARFNDHQLKQVECL